MVTEHDKLKIKPYLGRKQVKVTVFEELIYLLHDSDTFSTTGDISKQFQTKTVQKTCF